MMLSVWMMLAAIAVLSFSGLPACLLSSRSTAGQRMTTVLMFMGSLMGLGAIGGSLGEVSPPALSVSWFLPWGRFAIVMDSISVLFLIPVFLVPAMGSLYGMGYWKQAEHPENAHRLGLFYGLLAGSMAMVVVARDAVLFLMAWEIMAIAAYFAATAEDDNLDVCRAGWIYLIATHVGTLCLIAMFALWRHATGSFVLTPEAGIPAEAAGTIFVLCLIGFGFKAGLMPLHVWLPGAHANAPSHVSAVMSGVMLKMGVYGIIRMTALLPVAADWWGGTVLTVGVITGVAGIAFAIGQNDLKRILAYSSIENIGIISIGLGLALLGRSQNQPVWIVLGLCGALLHVWNHSLFKSLLFFNAGAIIHASHTRTIDQMGGLAKQMPQVMILFVIGAAAICALPPLNGFAGEWLIYNGLFKTLGESQPALSVAAVAAIPLAMIGALAVACFVKLFGTVFLGMPRRQAAFAPENPPATMILPMAVMAAGCIGMGLFPILSVGPLENAVKTWASLPIPFPLDAAAPLGWITVMGLALVALTAVLVLAFKKFASGKVVSRTGTWDCGYACPTARIQYTGTSLGQMLVSLFTFILLPRTDRPHLRGIFPADARFAIVVPDTILDRLIIPLFSIAGRYLPMLRVFQRGQTHLYVLYILIIVIVLLISGALGV